MYVHVCDYEIPTVCEGVTGREISARSTNLLATWMLEHPEPQESDLHELDTGLSMPPFSMLPGEVGLPPLLTDRSDVFLSFTFRIVI